MSVIDIAMSLQNAAISRWGAQSNEPFLDPGLVPWTRRLEAEVETIRSEFLQLERVHDALPALSAISSRQEGMGGDSWKSLFFRIYGRDIASSAMLCPATAELISSLEHVDTAMFSTMKPGAHIEAHSGPSKSELRYHLPLVVPSSDPEICGIRVLDEQRGWHVGESLLFDDTHDHEAWNRSTELRAVLFLGVRRPLPQPIKSVAAAFVGAAGRFHPDVDEIVNKVEAANTALVQQLLDER